MEPRLTRLCFALLLLAQLAPIWAQPWLPSQDGPAHLANAVALRGWLLDTGSVFREYYTLNPDPFANWPVHLLLAALVGFVPPALAEKLLLSAYALLLPLSLRRVLGALGAPGSVAALLAFPFVWSLPARLGFWSFVLALPVHLLALAFWLRRDGRLLPREVAALATLLLAEQLLHPVAFAASALTLGVLAGVRSLPALRTLSAGAGEPARRRLVSTAAALAPGAALLAVFVATHAGGTWLWNPPGALLRYLLDLGVLVSFDAAETWLGRATLALFAALVVASLAARRRARAGPALAAARGLPLAALALLGLYFVAPSRGAGGGFVNERLLLFPFLSLAPWLGAQPLGARVQRAAAAVVVVISVSGLALQLRSQARLAPYLADWAAAAEAVEPGSTLLQLAFSHRGRGPDGRLLALHASPFLHAAGHVAAARGGVDLKNYEAYTGWFPLLHRPERDPFRHIGRMGALPPEARFADYAERTGGRVDYVLLWDAARAPRADPRVAGLLAQLEAGFERVPVTSRSGLLELWRRRAALEVR